MRDSPGRDSNGSRVTGKSPLSLALPLSSFSLFSSLSSFASQLTSFFSLSLSSLLSTHFLFPSNYLFLLLLFILSLLASFLPLSPSLSSVSLSLPSFQVPGNLSPVDSSSSFSPTIFFFSFSVSLVHVSYFCS